MRKLTYRFFGAYAATSTSITSKTDKIADEMAHRAHLATVQLNDTLQLRQLTPIERSDHKAFELGGIVSWNMMMQGRGRNNGFGLVQTSEMYREHYTFAAKQVADWFKKGAKRVDLQEFVLEVAHQREFKDILAAEGVDVVVHHTRSFPVASIIHKDIPFRRNKHIESIVTAAAPKLQGRFMIFQSSDSAYHVNAHFPFDNTAAVFKQFYITLFEHLSATLELEQDLDTLSFHINADTNLSPEEQKRLLREAFDAVAVKNKHVHTAFSAKSYVLPSPAGHLKQEGDKGVLVSVDSAHLLVFSRAKTHHYYQATEEESKNHLYHYWISAAVIGGTATLNLVEDDMAAVALTGNLAAFFASSGRQKMSPSQEPRLITERENLWPY